MSSPYLLELANSAWILSSLCLEIFTSSSLGGSYFFRRVFIPEKTESSKFESAFFAKANALFCSFKAHELDWHLKFIQFFLYLCKSA